MRVLFSSTSGLGHIHPMLPLADALRQRGHDVVWATADDGRPAIEAHGFRTASAGLTWANRVAEYRNRFPEAASLRGDDLVEHMFPRLFGLIGTQQMFAALWALAAGWRPDLVISEAAELAAPALARALGVPNATHGFGLVIPPHRLQQAATAAAASLASAGSGEARPFGGAYDYVYIDIYPPSMQPEDLSYIGRIERQRPGSAVGPAGVTLAPSVAEALVDPRPLLYVTCGTIFNDATVLRTVSAALATMSTVVAVVTVGPGGDPEVLGAQPDHVRVVDYVPQDVLLGRAALVVSHAGSGTLLGALAHGVPQVCLPQAADQLRNARAAERAGAAIALFPDQATPDEIASAIARALRSETLGANAERLAAEIAAMPSPPDVAVALEGLVGVG